MIHKIALKNWCKPEPVTVDEVLISAFATFLTAQIQHGEIVIWYSFDTRSTRQDMCRFTVVATGEDQPEHARYIGTVQFYGGNLILHVYAEYV